MFNYIKQFFINYYYKNKLIDTIRNYIYLAEKLGDFNHSTYEYTHGLRLKNDYVLIWTLSREFMGGTGHILTKNNTIIVKNYNIDPYIEKSKYKYIYLDIIDDLKLKQKEYLEKRYSINNILK